MGKLNFRGYLILQFYPACEICENLMHMFSSIVVELSAAIPETVSLSWFQFQISHDTTLDDL